MRFIYLSIALIFCITVFSNHFSGLLADDRADRVKAGQRFLNRSRIDKWERYFSEGLPKLGKIVLLVDGEIFKEAWFEKDFMLIKDYHPETTFLSFSNPDYSAMVESNEGKHTLLNAGISTSTTEYVYLDALPFAYCSSVNLTRESIPRFLQQKKLKISDYRFEEEKHIVKLAFVDDSNRNSIDLVFYDNNPSMLPDEVIFNKETADHRHFMNTDFVNIEGFFIPQKLEEEGSSASSTVEVFPQERLNTELCRLPYYGLPEPGKLNVAEFGREGSSWRLIGFGFLCVIALITFIWFFKTFSKRK